MDVYRPTWGRGSSGAKVPSYGDATYAAVACNVQPATPAVKEEYMQRDTVVTHSIFYTTALTVGLGDRIVFDGNNYRVAATPKNVLELGTFYRLDVEREQS